MKKKGRKERKKNEGKGGVGYLDESLQWRNGLRLNKGAPESAFNNQIK